MPLLASRAEGSVCACVHSFMLYGSETWPVKEKDLVKLERNDARMVRWMCNTGPKDKISPEELFFNWDSLHARLNNHYEACSYKKKKHKKVKAYKTTV